MPGPFTAAGEVSFTTGTDPYTLFTPLSDKFRFGEVMASGTVTGYQATDSSKSEYGIAVFTAPNILTPVAIALPPTGKVSWPDTGQRLIYGLDPSAVPIGIPGSDPTPDDTPTPCCSATIPVPVTGTATVASSCVGAGITTWNPLDKGAGIVLSGGDRVATVLNNGTSGPHYVVRSTTSHRTGKFHFEIGRGGAGGANLWTAGLANSSAALSGSRLGANANSVGVWGDSTIQYNGAGIGTAGDGGIVTLAIIEVDLDANLFWAKEKTSAVKWNNNPSANPATGTGGLALSIGGGSTDVFLAWDGFGFLGDDIATSLNTCGSTTAFGVTPSAGFVPWDSTVDYIAANTTYIALLNGSMVELTGGAYARVAMAPADWSPSGGGLVNAVAITFPAATSAWGTAAYFAIFDAATSGTELAVGALASPQIIPSGLAPSFPIGYLTVG